LSSSLTEDHLIGNENQGATIDYGILEPCDLQQVHDLLQKIFWDGIRGNSPMILLEFLQIIFKISE
jgi:hypothetical protein